MKISAKMNPLSPTAREWRSRRLQHGLFLGVRFRMRGTGYVADDIAPEDVDRLSGATGVILEIFSDAEAGPAPHEAEGRLPTDEEIFGPIS